ncbi:MAG: DNA polymerase III subunit gamma/tau [Pyrinomonadaceae bacterium]
MSYQVIARKWRPQTFDEVTGQEPITRTLRNAIEHERLHHAYLFSGARGVGKTTTARLLAKALNCQKFDHPTATPCCIEDPTACASCQEIAEGRSIDVLEIDAASNTGVDNVRDSIIGNVAISPARDRYKVFIIDEVHMLSGAAFNALLKTLEEPPPRVTFIMATTESHKLPDTILSRVQQFEFRTIAAAKIAERLRLIADAEKITIADEALREIARAGEGSMRDAQSAFDQVISFSGAEIKVEDVETALGIAGALMLQRVIKSINAQKPADALAVVDDLVMRGHDLRNFCRDLLAYLRDLLVAKVSGNGTALQGVAAADRKELASTAALFSESDLVRFFHSLTETESNLRNSAHPRYQLEIGLVKLMEMQRLAPLAQLVERLAALEESLRSGKAPASNPSTPATSGGNSAPNTNASRGTSSNSSNARFDNSQTPPRQGFDAATSSHAARPDDPPFAITNATKLPPSAAALTLVPSQDQSARNTTEAIPPRGAFDVSQQVEAVNTTGQSAPRERLNDTTAAASAVTANAGSPLESIKTELEKRRRMFLVIALEGAHTARIEETELRIEFAPEAKHLRDNLAKPENVKILREVCRDVMGRDMGVSISVTEPGANEDNRSSGDNRNGASGGFTTSKREDAEREKQKLREIAEQHPLVQQVLRTFHGEIVDVRRIEEP